MNKKEKFTNFLESLKGQRQDTLIESVKKGFQVCFEDEDDIHSRYGAFGGPNREDTRYDEELIRETENDQYDESGAPSDQESEMGDSIAGEIADELITDGKFNANIDKDKIESAIDVVIDRLVMSIQGVYDFDGFLMSNNLEPGKLIDNIEDSLRDLLSNVPEGDADRTNKIFNMTINEIKGYSDYFDSPEQMKRKGDEALRQARYPEY